MVDSVGVPVGVKIIATWYFVGAVILLLFVPFFLGIADSLTLAGSVTSVLAVTGDEGATGSVGDSQYSIADSGSVGADEFAYGSSDLQGFNSDAFASEIASQAGQSILTGLLSSVTGSLPGAIIFVVLAVVCLFASLIQFAIGLGLLFGKAWARVVAIILSLLGLLSSALFFVVQMFWTGGFWVVFYALITGYLLFNKRVSESFAS